MSVRLHTICIDERILGFGRAKDINMRKSTEFRQFHFVEKFRGDFVDADIFNM
jgi:hypothetical protein